MKFHAPFKKIFYSSFLVLFCSGVLWLVFEKWIRIHGSFGEDPHPFQSTLLSIHGVVSQIFLLVMGYLLHAHVRPGLLSKKKLNLKSGYLMILASSLLILTSATSLFGPEHWLRDLFIQIHRYLGLVFPLLIFVHVKSGRKSRVIDINK